MDTVVSLDRRLLAINIPTYARILSRTLPIHDPYRFYTFDSTNYPGSLPWVRYAMDQMARQIYRHIFLRIPSMYLERLIRVFFIPWQMEPHNETPTLVMEIFTGQWADFVATLSTELNTMNIVATLLLSSVMVFRIYSSRLTFCSAIFSLLQFADAANQAVTRTLALLALLASLMTVVYCCLYTIRFNTMKSNRKGLSFAEVYGPAAYATKVCPNGFIQIMVEKRNAVLWNVLVLLALPAVWLAWKVISCSLYNHCQLTHYAGH